ncbi:MAG TPA: YciI family protein [Planctomycetota bacterium]|jgi:uncharacterized protein YciI|nr:YciI family protein [Planctomycetota bacterium]
MLHSSRLAFFLALLATSTLSCRAAPPANPKKAYSFVFLVTGPKAAEKTPEENRTIMTGHMANMKRLSEEGMLLIAGPFAKPTPDDQLRGIFILDTPEITTARAWVQTDPGVEAGAFAIEIVPFRTDAPLKRSLELFKAETAEIEKSGKPGGLTDRIRPYAMILAQDGERAERAIAKAHAEDRVIFAGNLEGSPRGSYLAILDVKDASEAEALLGSGSLGEKDLVGWWSAKTVAEIAKAGK